MKRMKRASPLSVLFPLALAAAAFVACGGSGSGEDEASNAPASGKGGKSGASGASAGSQAAGKGGSAAGGTSAGQGGGFVDPKVVSLEISPSSADLEVANGKPASVPLTAKPKYDNGATGNAITATWQVDKGDIALVDKAGVVTASGAKGGAVVVTASAMGVSATATVNVHLKETQNPGKVSTGDQALLTGATQSDGGPWMYPYDGTVFPRGLAAPKLMWGGAKPGAMMFSAKGEFFELTTFFTGNVTSFTPDAALWTKLTESGNGGPVEIKVARVDGGTGKLLMKHSWRVATANLRGTVYYWALSKGAVVRIKPGAAAPDDFLGAAGVKDGCTTCHAVSANGAVLTLGGGSEAGDSKASVFDLTTNKLTASNRGRSWGMLALTPDGKFAALNNAPLPGGPGKDGGFWDVATGAKVPGSGFDTELFDMPAFAPNGKKFVYVDHGTKGLVGLDYDQSSGKPVASNKVGLIAGTADAKNQIAFPVVSPDAKWAVYHRGALDTRNGPGDLVLAATTAPSSEVFLDATNGKTYPFAAGDRDRHYNYEPTFLPVAAGGYFWVLFTSRRTYGNQLTATKDEVKQLWVAAFDQHPTPGKDPSHPAFWLPGQDAGTLNMRGYWALDPCRSDGAGCSLGSECCSGSCIDASSGSGGAGGSSGGKVCGQPPGQTCVSPGGVCKADADCCGSSAGFTCINGYCSEPPPP